MIELSIIIVNWNGGQTLNACLESVYRAISSTTAEVWLVDNASEDGSAERAVKAHPELRFIGNRENLGFARAVNQALAQATGKFILLLNPDTEIGEKTLSSMLELMRKDGRVGIAGCSSVDAEGHTSPGYENSFPGRRSVKVAHIEGLGRDVAWISGACLMTRQEMIKEIGPLDPEFFMYYEDVDWCYRARQAGWRVVTLPQASIRHHLGDSAAQAPKSETARRVAASRLRFYRKHYSPWRAFWLAMRIKFTAFTAKAQRPQRNENL